MFILYRNVAWPLAFPQELHHQIMGRTWLPHLSSWSATAEAVRSQRALFLIASVMTRESEYVRPQGLPLIGWPRLGYRQSLFWVTTRKGWADSRVQPKWLTSTHRLQNIVVSLRLWQEGWGPAPKSVISTKVNQDESWEDEEPPETIFRVRLTSGKN